MFFILLNLLKYEITKSPIWQDKEITKEKNILFIDKIKFKFTLFSFNKLNKISGIIEKKNN